MYSPCVYTEKRMYHPVEEESDGNGTSLFDLLKGNPLHEVSGYWVFNESDISKYEDVDLSRLFRKSSCTLISNHYTSFLQVVKKFTKCLVFIEKYLQRLHVRVYFVTNAYSFDLKDHWFY